MSSFQDPKLSNVFKTFKNEDWVQYYWVRWMEEEYPFTIFHTNILQGVRIHPLAGARSKLLGSRKGMPDVCVYEAVGSWHGLFIEFKNEKEKIRGPKGGVYAKFKEQHEMLCLLRERGYVAEFACGTNEAIDLTKRYLSGHV